MYSAYDGESALLDLLSARTTALASNLAADDKSQSTSELILPDKNQHPGESPELDLCTSNTDRSEAKGDLLDTLLFGNFDPGDSDQRDRTNASKDDLMQELVSLLMRKHRKSNEKRRSASRSKRSSTRNNRTFPFDSWHIIEDRIRHPGRSTSPTSSSHIHRSTEQCADRHIKSVVVGVKKTDLGSKPCGDPKKDGLSESRTSMHVAADEVLQREWSEKQQQIIHPGDQGSELRRCVSVSPCSTDVIRSPGRAGSTGPGLPFPSAPAAMNPRTVPSISRAPPLRPSLYPWKPAPYSAVSSSGVNGSLHEDRSGPIQKIKKLKRHLKGDSGLKDRIHDLILSNGPSGSYMAAAVERQKCEERLESQQIRESIEKRLRQQVEHLSRCGIKDGYLLPYSSSEQADLHLSNNITAADYSSRATGLVTRAALHSARNRCKALKRLRKKQHLMKNCNAAIDDDTLVDSADEAESFAHEEMIRCQRESNPTAASFTIGKPEFELLLPDFDRNTWSGITVKGEQKDVKHSQKYENETHQDSIPCSLVVSPIKGASHDFPQDDADEGIAVMYSHDRGSKPFHAWEPSEGLGLGPVDCGSLPSIQASRPSRSSGNKYIESLKKYRQSTLSVPSSMSIVNATSEHETGAGVPANLLNSSAAPDDSIMSKNDSLECDDIGNQEHFRRSAANLFAKILASSNGLNLQAPIARCAENREVCQLKRTCTQHSDEREGRITNEHVATSATVAMPAYDTLRSRRWRSPNGKKPRFRTRQKGTAPTLRGGNRNPNSSSASFMDSSSSLNGSGRFSTSATRRQLLTAPAAQLHRCSGISDSEMCSDHRWYPPLPLPLLQEEIRQDVIPKHGESTRNLLRTQPAAIATLVKRSNDETPYRASTALSPLNKQQDNTDVTKKISQHEQSVVSFRYSRKQNQNKSSHHRSHSAASCLPPPPASCIEEAIQHEPSRVTDLNSSYEKHEAEEERGDVSQIQHTGGALDTNITGFGCLDNGESSSTLFLLQQGPPTIEDRRQNRHEKQTQRVDHKNISNQSSKNPYATPGFRDSQHKEESIVDTMTTPSNEKKGHTSSHRTYSVSVMTTSSSTEPGGTPVATQPQYYFATDRDITFPMPSQAVVVERKLVIEDTNDNNGKYVKGKR